MIWYVQLYSSTITYIMVLELLLMLGEDPEPQWVQASTLCIPIWPEEALRPIVTAGVAGPVDIQWQLPPLPLGLGLSPWCLAHPLEDVEPLVHLFREAQLDITSLATIEMVTVRNALIYKFKCHYRMWLISMTSLWLNPSKASTDWGLRKYPLKNPLQSCHLSKWPTHKTD